MSHPENRDGGIDTSLVPLPASAAVTGTGMVPIQPLGAQILLGAALSQFVMVCSSAVTLVPFLSLYSVEFSAAGVPSSWCVTSECGLLSSGCARFLSASGAGMFCCMLLGMSKYIPVVVAVIPIIITSKTSMVVKIRLVRLVLGVGVVVLFIIFCCGLW